MSDVSFERTLFHKIIGMCKRIEVLLNFNATTCIYIELGSKRCIKKINALSLHCFSKKLSAISSIKHIFLRCLLKFWISSNIKYRVSQLNINPKTIDIFGGQKQMVAK